MSLSIRIDVSKLKLDIYDGQTFSVIENTPQAIKKHFKKKAQDARVVMKATGKYHRLCQQVIEELGGQVMVINPYQARQGAKYKM
jgi:transposase